MNPYQSFAEKYRIKKYLDIKGQDKAVEEIKKFISEFPKKKAIVLYGPAGTGKTSLAIALANETNSEIFELNSSDLRNRKKLEETLKPATLQTSLFKKSKVILVDEVDGVTGTDIGGIPELERLIMQTKHPIIMTCNDIWQSKLSPIRSKSKLIEMKALPFSQILTLLKEISVKESLNYTEDFLKRIAIKSQGDIRAALNDLQAHSQGSEITVDTTELRDVEDNIFNILKRVFKEKQPFLNIYDSTKMSLDEILLWLEENIPKEYRNETLAKAYIALGNADLFKGRIYRKQFWRFLVYQNIFQSAGISLAKPAPLSGFTKYEPPKRILKIWLNNQKTAKRKTIIKKYARYAHCSVERATREFPVISKILKSQEIQKKLKLNEEEIEYIKKSIEV